MHIEDISRAFLAALEAPRELVHDEAFNVGRTDENYRIREVADDRRRASSPAARYVYADGGRAGHAELPGRTATRSVETLPAFQPAVDGPQGRRGALRRVSSATALDAGRLPSSRFLRIKHVTELQDERRARRAICAGSSSRCSMRSPRRARAARRRRPPASVALPLVRRRTSCASSSSSGEMPLPDALLRAGAARTGPSRATRSTSPSAPRARSCRSSRRCRRSSSSSTTTSTSRRSRTDCCATRASTRSG